jgi:hypothetical protein
VGNRGAVEEHGDVEVRICRCDPLAMLPPNHASVACHRELGDRHPEKLVCVKNETARSVSPERLIGYRSLRCATRTVVGPLV